MYAYTGFLSFFLPSFYLSKDLLNPNAYDNFCTIVPYPESCEDGKWYDWNDCTWSEGDLNKYLKYIDLASVIITVQFSLIVSGMSIILYTVLKNRKEIIRATQDNQCESTDQQEES